MTRFFGFLATTALLASPAFAGEMDSEFGPRRNLSPGTATASALARSDAPRSAEMDAEGPTQAWHHFGGYHHGFGWGGLGHYGGFGGFRGFGFGLGYGGLGLGLGYGGFGGFGGYGGYGYGGYGGYGYGYPGFGYGGFGGYGLGYGGYGGFGGFGFGYRRFCW